MVQQPRIHSSDVQTGDHVPDHAALLRKIRASYQIAEANRSAAALSIRRDAGSAFFVMDGLLEVDERSQLYDYPCSSAGIRDDGCLLLV